MSDSTPKPPTLSQAVTAELRAVMARGNISGAELARRLEVPASWVQRRTSGASPITVDEIERLAAGLGLEPLAIMRAAYLHRNDRVLTPELAR